MLHQILDFPTLVQYLEDELGWPLDGYGIEDLTFDYSPDELGLKAEDAAKIRSIRQLRPLDSKQPWGIFFIEFDRKKLPVVVLRRILSHLVVKKRASAGKADRAAWHAADLLFVSAFGLEDHGREISFAHFHQEEGDMPTLRVLGWDGGDTPLTLEHVSTTLREKLHWPEKGESLEKWRARWSGAFRHRIGHSITTADMLAGEMARLARRIRDAAQTLLASETEKGPLTVLHRAFQSNLIHDLTPEGFADTYAQTITYGLLTAAISRTDMSGGREGTALVAENISDMVPVTNPFLKEMLQTFLHAGGRKGGIDFDELGVQDVVDLLRGNETDLPAILRDFGNKTRGEDPVIHFYEHFLTAYNKQLRIQRGVFYTPRPVVSYIVRSVHELLQTEFGLAHGLADTTTWGEFIQKSSISNPQSPISLPTTFNDKNQEVEISPEEPFVQILDPATGTATFLVEVIEVIHTHLNDLWKKSGASAMPPLPLPENCKLNTSNFAAWWNCYVPCSLLPRLHAYELMMAPYAIAHMKIGLKLKESGFSAWDLLDPVRDRVRIYLTNALEPWAKQLPLIGFDALAHEAAAVNEVKRHKRFTVVIGNPPYSGVSSNCSETAVKLVDAYKFIDGEPLGERKHWLQDDYKKFIRIGQIKIEDAGTGIVGYITNHGFLDEPTARGMRRSLMHSFQTMYLIDAHGSLKKKEVCPDGTTDQNLFDIEPGVSIGLFQRSFCPKPASVVKHSHLWGLETVKCRFLAEHKISTTDWTTLEPRTRFYLFTPSDSSLATEYEDSFRLVDVFSVSTVGCVTARDGLTIHWNPDDVWNTVSDFASISSEMARSKYNLGKDARDWTVEGAQKDVQISGPTKSLVKPVLYRPFDQRFTYYTGQSRGFIGQPQPKVMRQFLRGTNLGLSIGRQGKAANADEWSVVFCSKFFTEFNLFRRGGNNLNPLYSYPADNEEQRELSSAPRRNPNLSRSFLKVLATRLGLRQAGEHALPSGLTPEDIFHYIYAVFHSPGYRSRYAEFLKIDFPRLPLTGSLELFRELARLGGELVGLHLLEAAVLEKPVTEFIGKDRQVSKVGWTADGGGTVWLDGKGAKGNYTGGSSGFRPVPEEVWNFHIGGYQVCEKWLKDRGPKKGQPGRTLSEEDISHYHKIVISLTHTIRLMAEIDETINAHGGWPGAFNTKAEA